MTFGEDWGWEAAKDEARPSTPIPAQDPRKPRKSDWSSRETVGGVAFNFLSTGVVLYGTSRWTCILPSSSEQYAGSPTRPCVAVLPLQNFSANKTETDSSMSFP